ncbi:reverse transcriptase domain-containing protein [Tanacetum coccineum]
MVRSRGHRTRPNEKIEQWMDNEISFLSIPRYQLVDSPIVLEAYIKGFQVRRRYVDGGSSSEVMYENCFRNLGPVTNEKLRESRKPLVGFSGEVNYPLGVIDLSVTMGEQDRILTVAMEFTVVKYHSPYNVILGRTRMRSLGVVASTIHSMINFLTTNRKATMVTNK